MKEEKIKNIIESSFHVDVLKLGMRYKEIWLPICDADGEQICIMIRRHKTHGVKTNSWELTDHRLLTNFLRRHKLSEIVSIEDLKNIPNNFADFELDYDPYEDELTAIVDNVDTTNDFGKMILSFGQYIAGLTFLVAGMQHQMQIDDAK